MGRGKLFKKLDLGRPLLQIALDLTDLDRAIDLALEAYALGFDIIEFGTPLIKLHGLNQLKDIKRSIPDALFLADLKIADTGRLEVDLVKNAGFDITTVLAVAGEEVVKEALEAGRDCDISVWIDLINIRDILGEVDRLSRLSPDIFILHVGIDVQRARGISAEQLENELIYVKKKGFRVAVAGGLNDQAVKKLIGLSPDILIVGGWITRSPDPVARMRKLVQIVRNVGG